MTEIKPKYIDGEPVCDGEYCPSFKSKTYGVRFTFTVCMCMSSPRSEIVSGNICIPALRRDRDKYKADALTMAKRYKEAMAHLRVLQREVCGLDAELCRRDGEKTDWHTYRKRIAKQRGWDCFEDPQ